MIFGHARDRAAINLAAICEQAGIDRAEVIIVDTESGADPIEHPPGAEVRVLVSPESNFGEARSLAVREASAPAIAFVEDHCRPLDDWVEQISGAWAAAEPGTGAIGYGFLNLPDDSYSARTTLLAEYGEWIHPAPGGPTETLPGNNVSYSVEVLREIDAEGEGRLARFLSADAILHNELRRRGNPMLVAPDAHVHHYSLPSVRDSMVANNLYSRQLAAQQADLNRWSLARRLLWAVLAPLGAPAIRTVRLIGKLGPARLLRWSNLKLLPGFTSSTSPRRSARLRATWSVPVMRVAESPTGNSKPSARSEASRSCRGR